MGRTEMEKQANFTARSKAEVVSGLTKLFLDCIDKGGTKQSCCIKNLVVDGHTSDGCGSGGDKGFDKQEIEAIATVMCDDCTITIASCGGGFIYDGEWTRAGGVTSSWFKILAKKGGTYRGYTGSVRVVDGPELVGKYPGSWIGIGVKKGDTLDEIKKRHWRTHIVHRLVYYIQLVKILEERLWRAAGKPEFEGVLKDYVDARKNRDDMIKDKAQHDKDGTIPAGQ